MKEEFLLLAAGLLIGVLGVYAIGSMLFVTTKLVDSYLKKDHEQQ